LASKQQLEGQPPCAPLRPALLKAHYFLLFAVFGSYLPFLSLHFKNSLGFSGTQVGSISSLWRLVVALAPPVWGMASDRFRGPKVLLAVGLAFSGVVLALFAHVAFYWQALLAMAVFAFFNGPLFPLLDSITFAYLRTCPAGSYGSLRVFGSGGFVIVSILLWWLVQQGAKVSTGFYVGAGCAFAALALVPVIPAVSAKPRGFIARRAARLYLQPDLLVLTVCGFLSYVSMMAYYSFFGIYLDDLGVAQRWIPPVMAIAAIAETPFIFYSRRIINRLGMRTIYCLGLGAVALRLLILSMRLPLGFVIASQLLHCLTFGGIFICGIIYIDERTPADLRASAQSFFNAALMGAGGFVGGLVSGMLADAANVSQMMGAHALIAAFALVLFVLFFKPQVQPAAEPGTAPVEE